MGKNKLPQTICYQLPTCTAEHFKRGKTPYSFTVLSFSDFFNFIFFYETPQTVTMAADTPLREVYESFKKDHP